MKIEHKGELIAIGLMLLATVGTIVLALGVEHYRRAMFYTVELAARAPDNGNWYPRTIKVPCGRPVKLLIRNIETVSHGFALPGFNVAVKEIKAGHVETVTFTPEKRGTFLFLCTVWCSERHPEMTGTLVVE